MRKSASVAGESKEKVLRTAKLLSQLGINPLTQGDVSICEPSTGYIVITPHDLSYDKMSIRDLVVIDEYGKVVSGRHSPSNESPVHCVVYRERKEVNGIVHLEPVFANAFGIVLREIPPVYVNMAVDVGGGVPVMTFADSGTESFGYTMLSVMGRRNAIVWANHGLLTVGKTLDAAFHCTLTVELGAKMYHIALCHGDARIIPQDKIDLLVG